MRKPQIQAISRGVKALFPLLVLYPPCKVPVLAMQATTHLVLSGKALYARKGVTPGAILNGCQFVGRAIALTAFFFSVRAPLIAFAAAADCTFRLTSVKEKIASCKYVGAGFSCWAALKSIASLNLLFGGERFVFLLHPFVRSLFFSYEAYERYSQDLWLEGMASGVLATAGAANYILTLNNTAPA